MLLNVYLLINFICNSLFIILNLGKYCHIHLLCCVASHEDCDLPFLSVLLCHLE